MKLPLTFLMLLMVFEPDGGGEPTAYRRYQNVLIPPYTVTEGTEASFEFFNTYGDDIQLTWRLTNSKYQDLLVYTQAFSPRMVIQKKVNLPGFVFDGGPTTLRLAAVRSRFTSTVNLTLYPRQDLTIEDVSQPFYSPPTITRIDQGGWIQYEREHVSFINMSSRQYHDVYGRFQVSMIQLRMHSMLAQDIQIEYATLLIANHSSLEGLNLGPAGYRQIHLLTVFVGDTIQFRFPQLYVHPQTLSPSQIPVSGYVPTNTLFFPMDAYASLKALPMILTLSFVHFHHMTLTYRFTYEASKAIIGHCMQSQTCVRIYA